MFNKQYQNFEEILKSFKKVSLRDDEKKSIRENLISYIENANIENSVRNSNTGRLSFRSQILTLINIRYMPIALLIALFLGGGGVSLAAEGSLPGDVLYPIKGISEKARLTFAFSEESKAELETKLASRRLEEAEELMAEGELDAEERANLEVRFEAHAKNVNKHIEKIREKKNFEAAAEISSNFESSLRSHEILLSRLSAKGAVALSARAKTSVSVENGLDDDSTVVKVRAEGKVFADLRRGIETEISGGANSGFEVAVGNKLESVLHKIAEVEKFIENKKDSVEAEVRAEAEAKLDIAKGLVAEARVKIEAKAYGEAFVKLQEAQRTAQEAKVSIEVSADFRGGEGDSDEEEIEANINADLSADDEDNESSNIRLNGNGRIKIGL